LSRRGDEASPRVPVLKELHGAGALKPMIDDVTGGQDETMPTHCRGALKLLWSSRRSSFVAIACCLALAACSGAQDDSASTPRPQPLGSTEEPSAGPDYESMADGLPASVLHNVLGRSAGDFLRLVEIEAETRNGAFVGWRVITLSENKPSWLDVIPGDVVTSINGMPVERPEDAQRIWETLRIASEVRIDLRRGEQERSFRIPVVDDDVEEAEAPVDERRGPVE
jgi:hypothetical protein